MARNPKRCWIGLGVRVLGVEQRDHVRVMDRRAVDRGAADDVRPLELEWTPQFGRILVFCSRRLPDRIDRTGSERVVLDQHDPRERGIAQVRGALGDGAHHRLDVGRRAGDHAQDLADGGLLLERVLELAGALLDLALEAGIRFPQLCRHPVETVGQRLELVAGTDFDLLVELAGADPLRAFGERADRSNHAAGKSQRAQRRDGEAREQQQAGAQDRRVELGVHLGHWLLDEHLPAQQIDGRDGRQHRRTAGIVRHHRQFVRRLSADRGFHMRERRQVGLAQHEADVGVGHQEAVVVDDVGLAFLADPDARHDVPYELEVDVGNGHRAIVAAGADGDRHVGLGLLAEVHRSEPRLSTPRIAKRGVLRTVLARIGDIHAEPRDGDLLVPGRIELRDVGHFRRLAQQLQKLDPAQFDIGRHRAAATPRT